MFFIRKEIIRAFKRDIFPYGDGFEVEKQSDEELDENKYFKYIENESEGINFELFKDFLNFAALTVLAKNYLKQKLKVKTVSL